jgi:hypothetical protein
MKSDGFVRPPALKIRHPVGACEARLHERDPETPLKTVILSEHREPKDLVIPVNAWIIAMQT